MFCFQCEQTKGSTGCNKVMGVCGKPETTTDLQDKLTGEVISLALCDSKKSTESLNEIIDALFTTVTNVNFDDSVLLEDIKRVNSLRKNLGDTSEAFHMDSVWNDNEDIRSLKSLILFGLRGVAAYVYHARALDFNNEDVNDYFFEGLKAIANLNSIDTLLPEVLKSGEISLKTLELLDKANTTVYGNPVPTKVTMEIEKGPFIVVSGHDLKDLHILLEQTKNKGINIYTHGEMLPCHGYPKLKEYSHLKGNFGTAWQNQQTEFLDLPAPVLFTTNCIMPVKENYADRIFTTAEVAYEGMTHIDENKDFTPVIEKALELGGYNETCTPLTGINGGTTLMTGFGHTSVLSLADTVIDAVKTGKISRFFLVGGCDGAKPGRNYFTDFVKQTPEDSIVLTLACGKYRFNDLDLGDIGGIPRILDVGQCNDSYSAVKIALALAEAFECSVNDLPLSLTISWYEQKAVCVLLALLHLGIQNINLGPTLPAFVSPNVLNVLVEKFNIKPTTTVEADLKAIIG